MRRLVLIPRSAQAVYFSVRTIIAFIAATGLCSCAYLSHGNTEELRVSSEPSGAQVVVSDGQTGTTPFSLIVRRDQTLVFHFTKPGYDPVTVTNNSHKQIQYQAAESLGFIVPIVGLFAAGSAIYDDSKGADYAHTDTQVSVKLFPAGSPAPPSSSLVTTVDNNRNWPSPPATANPPTASTSVQQ